MAESVLPHPVTVDPLIAEAKRRTRRRRLTVAPLVLALATATAIAVTRFPAIPATVAPEARWHATEACNIGGIALTAPLTGPNFHTVGMVGARTSVSMSYTTASSIAQRTGPNEFQPANTHSGTPGTVPCNVASSAASVAGNTWSTSERRHFGITAGWMGYAAGPTFRFDCVLRGARTLLGTCVHQADAQAGAVSVSFRIRPSAAR